MKESILSIVFVLLLMGCSEENETPTNQNATMYFPPISGAEWETSAVTELEWNESAIEPLKQFLTDQNTKSFMILVNGRIVIEEYFNGHAATSTWEWNSAGKTLVTAATGIAQQNGLIDINNKVSDYIGTGWTRATAEQEDLITVKNLLTMTSGLDDEPQLVIRPNLTYLADAGTRWAYGNVFQRLINVVEEASNTQFDSYFNNELRDKIGMDGYWNTGLVYTIYHSTTRSMARFGLLALNRGQWNDQEIIDEDFFMESINSSQNINPSYGYLWWLNGKSGYMIPGSQDVFSGPLVPNAPNDMYAAMGANDQRIYIVPGKNMVVIRMGEAANPDDPNFAVSGFDNVLWEKINDVID
ncbi:serine hydrolase [Fulvivirga maritima]|uniref:serine hydrolase domain-containing protein n=1 Tax=Fulvivirga maritima TaxID=2904247 RepID=UPI001F23D7BB|nr:serine hydrolase [Fulvivirga maritima]UII26478.1 serine hydrolase [Fulvivirga maritima]